MKDVDIKIITESLDSLKKEGDKRDEIYKHGVDLSNYENEYSIVAINLLVHMLGGYKDEVEWWLYENVDKVYFREGLPDYNAENSTDFVNFLLHEM